MNQNPLPIDQSNDPHNARPGSANSRVEAVTVDFQRAEQSTTPETVDEVIGVQLDFHLHELQGGKPTASVNPAMDAQVEELRPVVNQLHELAVFLTETEFASDLARCGDGYPSHAEMQRLNPGNAADKADIRPGKVETNATRIGKYEVVRKLGAGGQAGAFLAFDPDLRRHVVIKLYHQARTAREQEMILREGQALARVRSPFVAHCHSAERHEDIPYLVVEYIPGKSLAELLRDKPLSLAQALEMVRQVAEGLAAIHACGLLHRDIKPANIVVGDDGKPRLVDFGLAVPLGGESLRGVSGTLSYMAPEQARGEVERIDARSDLFGLGAVLYELLTGRPPYQASTNKSLWDLARQGDITSPREINLGLPATVNDLCMHCLAKDPGNRFSSASALIEALVLIRDSRTRSNEPLKQPISTRQIRFALGLAVAAAVLVFFGIQMLGSFDASPNEKNGDRLSQRDANLETKDRFGSNKKNDLKPAVNRQDEKSKKPHVPRDPQGRALRQDFPIEVKVIGGECDANGVFQLTEGDLVRFHVRLPCDAHMGIWHWDDGKNRVQLLPSKVDPDPRVRAGKWIGVPGDPGYAFEATASKTMEYVHIIASTRGWNPPQNGLATRGRKDSFLLVSKEQVEQAVIDVRGLKLVEIDKMSEAIVPFRVLPKKK